jgi:ATP-dependent helicase/DNAse subunit B
MIATASAGSCDIRPPARQFVGWTRDHADVPLTLVTGPANAEKARVVLDGYRAALARGEAPILVVPTFADVERYRTELAADGVVFGAQVVQFAWLVEEVARRGGLRGRPLGRLARERVAAAAVARSELRALAGSASTRGFVRELLRFVDELEERRVTPQRLAQALRAWAAGDPGRRAYGDEVATLYGAYRRALERLGRLDAPLHAAAALDALRERPRDWGATPVFFYGFDDLPALQRDAVEALAATGAEVTLSLSYEPGRMAFAGRATTFAELHREGCGLAPSTTGPPRARRCTISSAGSSSSPTISCSIPIRSIPAMP